VQEEPADEESGTVLIKEFAYYFKRIRGPSSLPEKEKKEGEDT